MCFFSIQVMAFRNTTILSFAGERRSMSVSERPSVLRSSLSFFGSTRDSTTNELHEHRSSEASDFNQVLDVESIGETFPFFCADYDSSIHQS
jgi:hypothetical protein